MQDIGTISEINEHSWNPSPKISGQWTFTSLLDSTFSLIQFIKYTPFRIFFKVAIVNERELATVHTTVYHVLAAIEVLTPITTNETNMNFTLERIDIQTIDDKHFLEIPPTFPALSFCQTFPFSKKTKFYKIIVILIL